MGKELDVSAKKGLQEELGQNQEQVLTLQKMRDLEAELDRIKDEQQSIKDIIKVDNIELNPMLKLNEAYLVELENKEKEISYQLYTEGRLIGISNAEGLIELDPEYVKQMDERFGQYGAIYLIPDESKKLDQKQLQQNSVNLCRLSQMEQAKGQETGQQQKSKKQSNANVSQMEADLGCDITSCVRIEDEKFSEEVLGYQTGHDEKYLGYSKSRNTFLLIGEEAGKYEEIKDICGAEGGGQAASKKYMSYDEQGNPVEEEVPEFVMQRRDGTAGALAIDMNYGGICVSNLTPSEQGTGKYVSEEINIGHSVRPTPEEIELEKQKEEEKRKAIEEKEKEVEQTEQEVGDGEASQNDLDKSKQELAEIQQVAQKDDDDDYDWSEGRPIPKH